MKLFVGGGGKNMSYGFTMAFATVPDKAAAYDLCQKATSALCEPAAVKEYVTERYKFHVWYTFENHRPTNGILDMWTKAIFQVQFVYWPHHNLLALAGEYPEVISKLFGPAIYFQNSVDQDYAPEIWDAAIPLFTEVKEAVPKMSRKDILKVLDWDESDRNDTPEHKKYEQRTFIYQQIFQALDLEAWTYGNSGQFERICMSGLTSQEKAFDVQRIARATIDRLNKQV